jgi:hypothetical protein
VCSEKKSKLLTRNRSGWSLLLSRHALICNYNSCMHIHNAMLCAPRTDAKSSIFCFSLPSRAARCVAGFAVYQKRTAAKAPLVAFIELFPVRLQQSALLPNFRTKCSSAVSRLECLLPCPHHCHKPNARRRSKTLAVPPPRLLCGNRFNTTARRPAISMSRCVATPLSWGVCAGSLRPCQSFVGCLMTSKSGESVT